MLEKFLMEKLNFAYRQIWGFNQLGTYFKQLFSFSPKKVIAAIVAIAEIFGLIIFDSALTPRGEALDLTGYEIVFEDEFDGTEIDLDTWQYWGTGAERGGYCYAPSQTKVENGNLIITGEYLEDGALGEGWYCGDLALREWYKQGYFEIKCKASAGGAMWSAFWIQAKNPYEAPYSQGGVGGAEIDIFEAMDWGDALSHNAVAQTIHCAGVDGVQEGFQSRMLGCFKGNDIYNEYNTYGLKWTEDEYIFYINGVETARSTFGNGVSQVEEQVRVSLCMGSEEDLAKLDPETYHSEFIVDYVRIYQIAE